MEIVAFDTDDKADGSGKAKITWISKTLLNTEQVMDSGTSYLGGYEASELRSYLSDTILPLIDNDIKNGIVEVTKISSIYRNGSIERNGLVTNERIWIPSLHELNAYISGGVYVENEGASYTSKYQSNSDRIKKRERVPKIYWTRTSNSSGKPMCVLGDGTFNSTNTNRSDRYIALGFCT